MHKGSGVSLFKGVDSIRIGGYTDLMKLYKVNKLKTGGACTHRHLTEGARDACQMEINQAISNRAIGRSKRTHKGGGRGKKYGSKCK